LTRENLAPALVDLHCQAVRDEQARQCVHEAELALGRG
jgi:hypothetical protein